MWSDKKQTKYMSFHWRIIQVSLYG